MATEFKNMSDHNSWQGENYWFRNQLENVSGDQDENETPSQSRVRLSLFPMSVIPSFAHEENTINMD